MLTKRQKHRLQTLLPDGKPKYVRIYDNDGESIDRYTVVFSGNYTSKTGGEHVVLAMNGRPFHPQGFGQHCNSMEIIDAPQGWAPAIGRKCHLGRRIEWEDLPEDCRTFVLREYRELWDLPK